MVDVVFLEVDVLVVDVLIGLVQVVQI
ncbi:hypothetical protein A2U01_0090184, partial [Trifolium medium]|nr:hypothetical protein [Trifolium medium]